MMARWRDDVDTAVGEGNKCEEYARILKPTAKTEAERVALKLIEFFQPCHDAVVDLLVHDDDERDTMTTTKHSSNCQNTLQILNGTALGDGVTLTYYSGSDSEEDDSSVKGTATKLRKKRTDQTHDMEAQKNNEDDRSWFIILSNGQTFEVVQNDLKNAEQYKVHLPTNSQFLSCGIAENKKRKQQRQWRHQKLQAEKEE